MSELTPGYWHVHREGDVVVVRGLDSEPCVALFYASDMERTVG